MPRTVRLIVVLILISLSGLVALQGWLLANALELRQAAFERHVMAALVAVTQDLAELETAEIAFYLADSCAEDQQVTVVTMIGEAGSGDSLSEEILKLRDMCQDPRMDYQAGQLNLASPDSQTVRVHMFPHGSDRDSILFDSILEGGEHQIALDRSNLDSARIVIDYETDGSVHGIQATAAGFARVVGGDSLKFAFVRDIVDRLIIGETMTLQERVDEDKLDSLLRLRLGEAELDLDYAFGVTTLEGDSLWLVHPDADREVLSDSHLRTRLFPHDMGNSGAELVVQFPEQTLYLWRQAGMMLPATAIFIGILVFCFAYTIRALGAQRHQASLMVDFVNNMTHEFKTPISTVALACEAIQRPDVVGDQARVIEFSEMIQSENRRMRRQTEKILQMAAIEDMDFELDLVQMDVHDVIATAVRNFSVQVEHRGGQLQSNLKAAPSLIVADKVHVAAIVHNLMDNALKYSPDRPDITIATANDVGGIMIAVEDKGMGIPLEDQKLVFDKYYRVSSGDTHDVKGFGLGLSYVSLMVRLHGGRVALSSQFGQGTRIELIFPREDVTARSRA